MFRFQQFIYKSMRSFQSNIIFIMSGKMSKWKQIKSTGDTLNKILTTNPPELPFRFTPKRDRAESVDQIFNTSRSHLHSSLEHSTINKTQQQSLFLYHKKTKPKVEKKEELEKRTSTNHPNLVSEKKQSSKNLGGSLQLSARNSQLISEIKKEYQNFKRNVLAELERQRQMIHKMVKELVLTFEYELEKLIIPQTKISQEVQISNLKVESKIKSIEDWKHRLASVSLPDTSNKQKRAELKAPAIINKDILKPQMLKEQDLQLPILPINLQPFLGQMATLKRQMQEFEKIIERPKQPIDQKHTKK